MLELSILGYNVTTELGFRLKSGVNKLNAIHGRKDRGESIDEYDSINNVLFKNYKKGTEIVISLTAFFDDLDDMDTAWFKLMYYAVVDIGDKTFQISDGSNTTLFAGVVKKATVVKYKKGVNGIVLEPKLIITKTA